MFHMYVGVRAGGGIGDQIEDPAGDEYEIYRIIFDITFFFFVIVILLAIIQGETYHTQFCLCGETTFLACSAYYIHSLNIH